MNSLKNKSLFIQSADNKFWMRIFRRKSCFFSLTNFSPSAYPNFIEKLERIVSLHKLSNYTDTNMGVLIFSVTKGIPVSDIQSLLTDLSSITPLELIHRPQ